MSDVVFGRLRALLGTGGVERDADGLPRATPDSADALSLVCRLAHDEGWKIRVEGHGTWLAGRRPGRSRGQHPRARSRALGEPGRSGGHGPGGHADRGAAAAARRRRDVARPRSAGPARAEPRLGRGDGHRRPAASRLRPGARSRARLHRRDRRRAAGDAPAGGWSRTSRATTSPSSRSAASAGSASSPKCISGSGPCRAPTSPLIARGPRDDLTLRRARRGGRPAPAGARSSCSLPRSRPSRTGSSPRDSWAPTPRCRPTCGG